MYTFATQLIKEYYPPLWTKRSSSGLASAQSWGNWSLAFCAIAWDGKGLLLLVIQYLIVDVWCIAHDYDLHHSLHRIEWFWTRYFSYWSHHLLARPAWKWDRGRLSDVRCNHRRIRFNQVSWTDDGCSLLHAGGRDLTWCQKIEF
jgi:hypothetical protein